MTYSNTEIVNGILKDDRAIFTWLYQNVGNSIIGHVIKKGGSEEDGQEMFRIAILKTKQKLKDKAYEDKGKIEAYIFQIAKYSWLEELRSRKKISDKETSMTDKEYWIADNSKSVEEKIVQNEEVSLLDRCLKMLDEKCKELIQLHYYASMSFVDIATEMNEKPATIRKRHFDCRKRLKNLFDNVSKA